MINGVGGIVGDAVEEEEDADGRVDCGKGKLGRGIWLERKLEYWSRMRLDEEWEKVVEGRSSE